ncbi:trigger factor-like [Rhodamnia argentea]|uniref:Trigger factor-like n=1 Tax=Rhodamnia argentea TaxID=178133 RepID=A0A8B8QFN8_9MYRT|nr:trigger factor-like [Rhodamnia argentea]
MLDITADSVTQVASNSLAVFCFCNLLIVIILMSPKPSSDSDEGSEFHLPILAHSSLVDEQRIDIERSPEDEGTSPEVLELLCVCENLEKEGGGYNDDDEDDDENDSESNNDDENDDDEDDGESNNDDDNDDDEDDEEFRRRVEAFIDKVNREWKAEKLRTQCLCEQVDF